MVGLPLNAQLLVSYLTNALCTKNGQIGAVVALTESSKGTQRHQLYKTKRWQQISGGCTLLSDRSIPLARTQKSSFC